MSKNKRFTIKEFSTLDAMSSLDVICDKGIELPSSTACDLLNELSEENEELKQQLQSILKLTNKIEEYTYDIKLIGDME